MNKLLEVGQRVYFNTNSRWEIGENNPKDCFGTVQDSPDGWVWVKWDNGCENAYRPYDEDLVPVEEG